MSRHIELTMKSGPFLVMADAVTATYARADGEGTLVHFGRDGIVTVLEPADEVIRLVKSADNPVNEIVRMMRQARPGRYDEPEEGEADDR